jgi:hypothetical protein
LGVQGSVLRRWVQECVADSQLAFRGQGSMKPEQAELARLRREIITLKAERDFLKNAAAYFAKEALCNSPSSRHIEECGRRDGCVRRSVSRAQGCMRGGPALEGVRLPVQGWWGMLHGEASRQ